MTTCLPHPGLRPFEHHGANIFFGREEQTDELLRKLGATRFLAVFGPSGCGKSSLVRAGMMAALETGFVARAGHQWRVAVMRPGSHPVDNLAASLRVVPKTRHAGQIERAPLGRVNKWRGGQV